MLRGSIAVLVGILGCAGCGDDGGTDAAPGDDACGPLEIGHCLRVDASPCDPRDPLDVSFSPLPGDGTVTAVLGPYGGYWLELALRARSLEATTGEVQLHVIDRADGALVSMTRLRNTPVVADTSGDAVVTSVFAALEPAERDALLGHELEATGLLDTGVERRCGTATMRVGRYEM